MGKIYSDAERYGQKYTKTQLTSEHKEFLSDFYGVKFYLQITVISTDLLNMDCLTLYPVHNVCSHMHLSKTELEIQWHSAPLDV